jgi:hypothetical protein
MLGTVCALAALIREYRYAAFFSDQEPSAPFTNPARFPIASCARRQPALACSSAFSVAVLASAISGETCSSTLCLTSAKLAHVLP